LYINDPLLQVEKETLTPTQQLNEYIMISLRTMEGLELDRVTVLSGEQAAKELRRHAEHFILEGKLYEKDGRLTLSREGKLLADGIAAELLFEQE
jgi:oxygen-independent coproporphyrinogen-3 oxidase